MEENINLDARQLIVILSTLIFLLFRFIYFSVACSHRRGILLYSKSINPKNVFKAILCESQKAFDKGKCKKNSSTLFGEPWLKRFLLQVN